MERLPVLEFNEILSEAEKENFLVSEEKRVTKNIEEVVV